MPTEQPTNMDLEITPPSPDEMEGGTVAHFRHESEDGWTVAGTVSRSPNGHVISHLEIWPGRPGDAPGGSVTSKVLTSIRVGQIIDAVRYWEMQMKVQAMASRMKHESGDERAEALLAEVFSNPMHAPGSQVTIKTADEIIGAAPKEPRPGRAPLPDELMRQVAEGYISECGPGQPRGAVKRLAQRLGRPEATVARWVTRARKEGWLGPGASGREIGEPGPRLLAARAEGDAEDI
ncbi:hypothetical protein ALMP_37340 [Streptomyces sp. A012304]|nr:hypothetical protein ALMP_37340 [Streptomyces sp. A012304]